MEHGDPRLIIHEPCGGWIWVVTGKEQEAIDRHDQDCEPKPVKPKTHICSWCDHEIDCTNT